MKKSGNKNKILFRLLGIFLFCLIAGIILLFWFDRRIHYFRSDEVREADVAALSEEDYEGLLLSMYAPETFDGEDFNYFRGIPTVQAFHTFKNLADIGDYLERGFSYDPDIQVVYIGLDPYKISGLYGHHASLYARDYAKYLTSYVEAYPETDYEILIPARSLEHLRSLPQSQYDELIQSYRNLVNIYAGHNNVKIYFMGHVEWLISNPGNYVSSNAHNSNVMHIILPHTFDDDSYVLTTDNMEERFAQMTELVQTSPIDYPDLSEWCMVFLGDSVMAYHHGSYSIPGVVGSLSGAQSYNCGIGGTAAAGDPAYTINFNSMANSFIRKDTGGLMEGTDFALGLHDFLQEDHDGKRYCFVIEYGLNDYFNGFPVDNPEDSYDVDTYAGALRTGIRALQEEYPDSEILLLAPTYTLLFSGGTEKNSEVGGVLTDYVDAAIRVAEEMDVHCMNNYADSGINADTQKQYLADGTHPNQTGALLLGVEIIEYMGNITEDQ